MAKKTNKTAHVLNLISQPKTDENQIENNDQNTMAMTKNLTSHSLSNEKKEENLSQQIKANLTDFVENTKTESANDLSSLNNPSQDLAEPDLVVATPESKVTTALVADTPEPIDSAPMVDMPIDSMPITDTPKPIDSTPMADMPMPIDSTPMADMPMPIDSTPVVATSAPMVTEVFMPEFSETNTASIPQPTSPNSDSKNIPLSTEKKPDLISTTPTHHQELTKHDHAGYTLINIPEHLIQNEVLYFLKKFDTCTCRRCVADVTALALNNLTPKYIVVDNSSIAPLLSFFSSKLKPSVTFELSKACMVIKNNPKH